MKGKLNSPRLQNKIILIFRSIIDYTHRWILCFSPKNCFCLHTLNNFHILTFSIRVHSSYFAAKTLKFHFPHQFTMHESEKIVAITVGMENSIFRMFCNSSIQFEFFFCFTNFLIILISFLSRQNEQSPLNDHTIVEFTSPLANEPFKCLSIDELPRKCVTMKKKKGEKNKSNAAVERAREKIQQITGSRLVVSLSPL